MLIVMLQFQLILIMDHLIRMLWHLQCCSNVNCSRSLVLVQEVNQKDDFDRRRIRAERDQAYQELLKADIAKVSYVLVAECVHHCSIPSPRRSYSNKQQLTE